MKLTENMPTRSNLTVQLHQSGFLAQFHSVTLSCPRSVSFSYFVHQIKKSAKISGFAPAKYFYYTFTKAIFILKSFHW